MKYRVIKFKLSCNYPHLRTSDVSIDNCGDLFGFWVTNIPGHVTLFTVSNMLEI